MNFVTFKQFYADIASWEKDLPEFDAVCGIPRSGLIPASYIALKRNIRLVAFESLCLDCGKSIQTAMVRSNNPISKKPVGNRLLIVDDATGEDGLTIKWVKSQLANCNSLNVKYGAVYKAAEQSSVDHCHRLIPQPRMFEWNWLRNVKLDTVLFDCDGVLCHDWRSRLEQANDPGFLAHVTSVSPLFLPQVPIYGIVTSRLEKYRKETEAWLKKYGVRYRHLIMHPAKTPEERRLLSDHGKRKAEAYLSSPALLFVESDIKQAIEIHKISKKPVLCTDTMEFFPGS